MKIILLLSDRFIHSCNRDIYFKSSLLYELERRNINLNDITFLVNVDDSVSQEIFRIHTITNIKTFSNLDDLVMYTNKDDNVLLLSFLDYKDTTNKSFIEKYSKCGNKYSIFYI